MASHELDRDIHEAKIGGDDLNIEDTTKYELASSTAGQVTVSPGPAGIDYRAWFITFLCGLNWIGHLYVLTIFAAFARNIGVVFNEPTKAIWIFNAASVVTVVCAPTFSYLSDIYGRRNFMIYPFAFGVIGGVIGCRAKSIEMVIAASALVGVAASLFGIVTAIPSEVLPHKYRSYGQALVFIMSQGACLPSNLGIGRAIQNDPVNGWRWIFYSLIILYGVQPVLWFFSYHPPKRSNELVAARPKLDYIGYILLAIATVPFLMALSWGGVVYKWKSVQVLSTLIIGIFGWTAFGVWEWKGRNDGILHHGLFKDSNFAWSVVGLTVEGWTYLTFSAIYPAHTQTVFESNIFKAGVRTLPFNAAFVPMLAIGSWYVTKSRNMVIPSFIGYVIFTGAIVGFIFTTPTSSKFFLGMDALAGFGFSQPLVFLTIIGQFAVPASLIGNATALLLTIRGLGGAVGQAVANAVVQSKLEVELPARIAAATIPLGLSPSLLGEFIPALASGNPEAIGALLKLPGVTPAILEAGVVGLKSAFNEAYKYAWITLAPVSAVGCFACLLLKGQKEKFNDVVDAPLAEKNQNLEEQRA